MDNSFNKILFLLQELANILHCSKLIDDETIKKHLELGNTFKFSEIPFKEPGIKTKLEQRELGRLAKEVHKSVMYQIITKQLGISAGQASTVMSQNLADSWSAEFEILVNWSYKKRNTREMGECFTKFFTA